MHRGQLQVSSQADPAEGPTGTTFVIILPANKGAESSPKEESHV